MENISELVNLANIQLKLKTDLFHANKQIAALYATRNSYYRLEKENLNYF